MERKWNFFKDQKKGRENYILIFSTITFSFHYRWRGKRDLKFELSGEEEREDQTKVRAATGEQTGPVWDRGGGTGAISFRGTGAIRDRGGGTETGAIKREQLPGPRTQQDWSKTWWIKSHRQGVSRIETRLHQQRCVKLRPYHLPAPIWSRDGEWGYVIKEGNKGNG